MNMSISKDFVNIYKEYLKEINNYKKTIKAVENMKRRRKNKGEEYSRESYNDICGSV